MRARPASESDLPGKLLHQQRNARVGYSSCRWRYNHEIEGYASKTGYTTQEPVTFYINVKAPESQGQPEHFDIQIYRMGWYGGKGARLIATLEDLAAQPYDFSEANHVTGLIECSWGTGYNWSPPAGTVSGFFFPVSRDHLSGLQ
jgi:hypothetical protein